MVIYIDIYIKKREKGRNKIKCKSQRKGQKPTLTQIPTIVPIEIIGLFLNFNILSQLPMVEKINLCNDLKIFNANMVLI